MTFGDALGLRGCDDAHAFHSGWLSWPNMHGLTPHGADGVINMTVSLLSMSHGEVAKGMCLGSGLFGRSMGREVPSLRWVSDSKLLSLDSDMVPERDARPSTQDARQSTQDASIITLLCWDPRRGCTNSAATKEEQNQPSIYGTRIL